MMAKAYRFLFLLILSLACISPVFPTPTRPAEPALHGTAPPSDLIQEKWQTFTSAAGRFSVLLPAVPVSKTINLPSVKRSLQQFICGTDKEFYLVQYVDGSARSIQVLGAEKMLLLADNAFLKANHVVFVSKQNITLNGYPCHEIVANCYDGRKEIQRTYFVGTRRYTLITIQPHDQVGEQSPDAGKFFNSFTLLPPDDHGKNAPYGKPK